MIFSILNIAALIFLVFFYVFVFHKSFDTIYIDLVATLFVGILLALNITVMFILESFNISVTFLLRLQVLFVYYFLLSLLHFSCFFLAKKQNNVLKIIITVIGLLVSVYTLFYLNLPETMISYQSTESIFDFTNSYYSPYGFIFPIISIIILLTRSTFHQNNVEKFRLVISSLVFILILVLYALLSFNHIGQETVNFLFSFAVLLVLFLLYKIAIIDHVFSQKTVLRFLSLFFKSYVSFAALAAVVFSFMFYYFSENIFLLILGSILLLTIFILHIFVRIKVKQRNDSKNGFPLLDDFFTNLDYSHPSSNIITTFSDTLINVIDASSVDLFVLNGENLTMAYTTRNLHCENIPATAPFLHKLVEEKVFIISKEQISANKRIQEIEDEVMNLFTLCEAQTILLVVGEGRLIGLISLGVKNRSIEYNKNDFDILNSFYPNFFVFMFYVMTDFKESLMGVIKQEIHYSGQVAEAITKNIDAVPNPSVDVGMLCLSMRNLGGDFIESIRLTNTRQMFVLGDVSGRGLNASMCMIIIKSFIRTFLTESGDFIDLLKKVNIFIKHNLPRGTFFAGTFMILDTSEKSLYYVNCGVPGIFLYTQSYNNVIEIQGKGRVLGFLENIEKSLEVKKIDLNPGDIVLTCTDGVTDSISLRGEQYGKRRIEDEITENKSYPAENICTFLYDGIRRFTAKGVSDDISILVLKMLK